MDGLERIWKSSAQNHSAPTIPTALMAHVPRIHWLDPVACGQNLAITGDRAHHLLRVLKRRTGDALILFQQDYEFDARIVTAAKNQLDIEIIQRRAVATESPLNTVLIQSLSRGEKMDFTIQKAVELGVSAIVPVISQRGGVQLDAKRLAKKQAHWQAVAQSAAEQSGRTHIPQVHDCKKLESYLKQQAPLQGLVLDPFAAAISEKLADSTQPISILIGPEGGLSETEVQLAQHSGLTPTALGPRILRTESAGLVALTAVQLRWGDLA